MHLRQLIFTHVFIIILLIGPRELLSKLPKVKLKKPPQYLKPRQLKGQRLQNKVHERPTPLPKKPPYQFEDPLNSNELFQEASQIQRRSDSIRSNVHEYIPQFVKVALAKSFLKSKY